MKWFTEVFLPSLLTDKSSTWITEKQVAICRRYMKSSNFDFLYIIVDNYQYSLSIMKRGYGRLTKENKLTAFH